MVEREGCPRILFTSTWYLTHLVEHLEEKENPSTPHSVIIHKLTNGNYAIDNIPEDPATCENTTKGSSEWGPACYTCEYKARKSYLEPCKSCERCSKWTPKEETDKEET